MPATIHDLFPMPANPPAGSSPPHVADNDPSPENGCEKSPAPSEALYFVLGVIVGLLVIAVFAV